MFNQIKKISDGFIYYAFEYNGKRSGWFDRGSFSNCLIIFSDPRSENFLIVKYRVVLVALFALYLYMAKKGGKMLMKNRKPFELKTALIVYNILQIIFNAWFAVVVRGAQNRWNFLSLNLFFILGPFLEHQLRQIQYTVSSSRLFWEWKR